MSRTVGNRNRTPEPHMMSSGAGTSSTSGGHLKPMSHVGEGILGAVNTSGSLRFKSGGAGSPSLRVEPEPDGPFRLLIKAPPPKLPDIAEDMDVLRAIQYSHTAARLEETKARQAPGAPAHLVAREAGRIQPVFSRLDDGTEPHFSFRSSKINDILRRTYSRGLTAPLGKPYQALGTPRPLDSLTPSIKPAAGKRKRRKGRPGARDEPNGGESLFPLRMGGGGSAGARAVSPDGAGGDDDDLDDGRHGHHHGRRSRASRTLSPHRDFGKASTRTQRDELEESRFPHRFLVEATDRLQKCKSGLSLVGYVHGDLDLGRLFPPVQVFARSFVHHTTNVCQAVRAPAMLRKFQQLIQEARKVSVSAMTTGPAGGGAGSGDRGPSGGGNSRLGSAGDRSAPSGLVGGNAAGQSAAAAAAEESRGSLHHGRFSRAAARVRKMVRDVTLREVPNQQVFEDVMDTTAYEVIRRLQLPPDDPDKPPRKLSRELAHPGALSFAMVEGQVVPVPAVGDDDGFLHERRKSIIELVTTPVFDDAGQPVVPKDARSLANKPVTPLRRLPGLVTAATATTSTTGGKSGSASKSEAAASAAATATAGGGTTDAAGASRPAVTEYVPWIWRQRMLEFLESIRPSSTHYSIAEVDFDNNPLYAPLHEPLFKKWGDAAALSRRDLGVADSDDSTGTGGRAGSSTVDPASVHHADGNEGGTLMNVLSGVRSELRTELMSELSRRVESREHVMASKEYLAMVASRALTLGRKWANHRNRNPILAPGRSFWVDLHEQMSSNVEQLARAVYFWRALLFFLAYNGSPTLPRAVDILSFVRSKLMSGSDASGDLFFAMLNWMVEKGPGNPGAVDTAKQLIAAAAASAAAHAGGSMSASTAAMLSATAAASGLNLDDFNQREILKIVHFVRCAVGVDVWAMFNHFKQRGWPLPDELRQLKKKMQQETGEGM